MQPSSSLVVFMAATSCLSQGATAAIMIYLAVQAHSAQPALALATSASVLDMLALASSLAIVYLSVNALPLKANTTFWVLSTFLHLSGAALSLALSACILSRVDGFVELQDEVTSCHVSASGLVMACISLGAYLITAGIGWKQRLASPSTSAGDVMPYHESKQSSRQRLSMRLSYLASSPALDRRSSQPDTSSDRNFLGSSISRMLRPSSSDTGLMSTKSESLGTSSRPYTPTEPMRQVDDPENWETASISQELGPNPSVRSFAKHRLSTIPGSRPASPARALNGPFPQTSPVSPVSPTSPMSPPLSPLETPVLPATNESRPASETSSLRNIPRPSRPRTPSTSETHIHPLFRSESPAPPPLASPGTIITASPYAGQIIGPDHVLAPRMLGTPTGSRPASPAVGPPRSRPGSSNTYRGPSPSQLDLSLPLHRQPSVSSFARSND